MICKICDLPNELQNYILGFLGWHLRNGKWIAPIAETKKQALLRRLLLNKHVFDNHPYYTLANAYATYIFNSNSGKKKFYYWAKEKIIIMEIF